MAFFDEPKKQTATGTGVDKYFKEVEGYPGLSNLQNAVDFKNEFPEFANKLGEELSKLKEKPKGEKRNKENSIDIDGYSYYWTMFNNAKQVNRIKLKDGGGAAGQYKPRTTIIHQPMALTFTSPEEAGTVLVEQAKGANTYTRLVEIIKDATAKPPTVVVEQYKLIKVKEEDIP